MAEKRRLKDNRVIPDVKQCVVWKQWRWFESWHLHPGRTDLPKLIINNLVALTSRGPRSKRRKHKGISASSDIEQHHFQQRILEICPFWNKRQDSYAPTLLFQVTWTFLCSLNISRSRSACIQQWKAGSHSGARPPRQPAASACCCCRRSSVCLWSSEARPRLIKLKPPPEHGQMPTYFQI